MRGPSDDDYRRLLGFRTGLRRFLHWSADQAQAQGITSAQHQLLLAVRGHSGGCEPTIGEIADYLVIRHHSAVGLIDRAVAAGLVIRHPAGDGSGTVRIGLTELGHERLEALSAVHLGELARLAPSLEGLWEAAGLFEAAGLDRPR